MNNFLPIVQSSLGEYQPSGDIHLDDFKPETGLSFRGISERRSYE